MVEDVPAVGLTCVSVRAFRPQHVPDIEPRDVTRGGPGCGGGHKGGDENRDGGRCDDFRRVRALDEALQISPEANRHGQPRQGAKADRQ